jgi:4-nitrophenyl phosphatase
MSGRFTPEIKGLILDMDGVLWRDTQPIGNLPEIFGRIKSLELKFIFATNNSLSNVDEFYEKITRFGVEIEPGQIINSQLAMTHLLKTRFPDGGPIFVIGSDSLKNYLFGSGFHQDEEQARAVVVGMDRQLSYEKLRTAMLLINQGVPFYGTNPDVTFPTPQGLVPGTGSLLAALQIPTKVAPIIAGKPETPLFELAASKMGLTPRQILSVGDRLDTDVLGAQRFGCRSGLVLSGVTNAVEAAAWQSKPDIIAADLSEIIGTLSR